MTDSNHDNHDDQEPYSELRNTLYLMTENLLGELVSEDFKEAFMTLVRESEKFYHERARLTREDEEREAAETAADHERMELSAALMEQDMKYAAERAAAREADLQAREERVMLAERTLLADMRRRDAEENEHWAVKMIVDAARERARHIRAACELAESLGAADELRSVLEVHLRRELVSVSHLAVDILGVGLGVPSAAQTPVGAS